MLQISHRFFAKIADELNISLGNEREYGVGMFFFPQNEHLRAQAMKLFGDWSGPAAMGRAVSISCVFLSVKSRAQRLFPAGTNGPWENNLRMA